MVPACDMGPVQYGGSIESIREVLSEHFHRLGQNSRSLRFLAPASDEWIDTVVKKLDPDCVIGIEIEGETRGVLELHDLGDGHSEIGISVEDDFQGMGYGKLLFQSGLKQARLMGITTAELYFSRGNTAVLQLVRMAGASIEVFEGEILARIDVTCCRLLDESGGSYS